jgi:hypothetical protein
MTHIPQLAGNRKNLGRTLRFERISLTNHQWQPHLVVAVDDKNFDLPASDFIAGGPAYGALLQKI